MNESHKARSRILWAITPPVLRGVGKAFFSLEVEFEADLPTAPFVVAANHYSHFDPPALGAVLDQPVRFLALEDLFEANGVLEWLVVGYGSIPVPRQRLPVKAVRTALQALEAGEIVGVFPESTRVSHWGTVAPRRGAAWLASRAGVPLVPVAVIGTGRAFGLENRVRRAPIRVIVGQAMTPENSTVGELMDRWERWISQRVSQHPGHEVSGPPRAFHAGS